MHARIFYTCLRKRAQADVIKSEGYLLEGGDLRLHSNAWVRSAFKEACWHQEFERGGLEGRSYLSIHILKAIPLELQALFFSSGFGL